MKTATITRKQAPALSIDVTAIMRGVIWGTLTLAALVVAFG